MNFDGMQIDTAEVDREIAELEQRIAALDARFVKPDGTFDGSVMTAQDRVARALKVLIRKREDILAGERHPPAVLSAPTAPRLPSRITPKSEVRKCADVGPPASPELMQELGEIFKKHAEADAVAKIEDEFRDKMQQCKDRNFDRPALYSQAVYAATLLSLARIETDLRTITEFHRNRRVEFAARLDAFEARIAQIEARPVMLGWAGVYAADVQYKRGTCCTYDGSMWHANKDVCRVLPGTDDSWTLCVKRGRDGRDR